MFRSLLTVWLLKCEVLGGHGEVFHGLRKERGLRNVLPALGELSPRKPFPEDRLLAAPHGTTWIREPYTEGLFPAGASETPRQRSQPTTSAPQPSCTAPMLTADST